MNYSMTQGGIKINWEQRVDRYLKAFGYESLGIEGGLVFYRDTNGRVWGSNESALNRNMVEWEKGI